MKKYLELVITTERLSNNELAYVAKCTSLGVASQGKNLEEAIKNVKEAVGLYLEELPEKLEELNEKEGMPTFSFIEVNTHDKASTIIR